MQIAYISKRPELLARTLQDVQRFMPFVQEVLVLCPAAVRTELLAHGVTIPSIKFVAEEDCMDSTELDGIRRLDHQSRNYRLRSCLVNLDAVADEFLMSDDDARPLRPVAMGDFKIGGRYRSYYFYDLRQWSFCDTDFDVGQCNTGEILNYFKLPTLAYASHMPQIINKSLYRAAVNYFSSLSQRRPICEWSSYFNFAIHSEPGLFHEPEPYRTLCWPDTPMSWPLYVEPRDVLFENHYPNFYNRGGAFFGLKSSAPSPSEPNPGLDKLIAWRMHTIRTRQGNRLTNWLARLMSRIA